MKTLLLALVGLTLCLTRPALTNAMNAEELIAKHLEAIGGVEKIKAKQSMRATGTVQVMGMDLPFTVVQKRGHKMRIDSSMMGSAFIQAFDGENGWTVNPMTGSQDPEDMPEIAEKVFAHEADMDGLLVDYASKGYTVSYVGEDEVEGTPVYHLKLTTADGIEYNMYFDTEYYLLIKQSRTFSVDENPVTEDTYFGDFQEVDGLVLPYSIEQRRGGQTFSQVMTDTTEFNVEIADDYFAKPAAEAKDATKSDG